MRVLGLHYVIDQLSDNYEVKLGPKFVSFDEEESRNYDLKQKMAPNTEIQYYGDGIKAFVALVCLVATLGYRFIFIDDPEVYLHTPIAGRLGTELMKLIDEKDGQLFVSMHSSEFLQGCIEYSSELTIVRLTYDVETGTATTRNVSPQTLQNILHDRLLRRTGVFDAFFHYATVIVESESDKMLYDEINRRLVEINEGTEDALFVSARNWQTTGDIVGPLREAGIPAGIMIDIDVLRVPSDKWKNIPSASNLPAGISIECRN